MHAGMLLEHVITFYSNQKLSLHCVFKGYLVRKIIFLCSYLCILLGGCHHSISQQRASIEDFSTTHASNLIPSKFVLSDLRSRTIW